MQVAHDGQVLALRDAHVPHSGLLTQAADHIQDHKVRITLRHENTLLLNRNQRVDEFGSDGGRPLVSWAFVVSSRTLHGCSTIPRSLELACGPVLKPRLPEILLCLHGYAATLAALRLSPACGCDASRGRHATTRQQRRRDATASNARCSNTSGRCCRGGGSTRRMHAGRLARRGKGWHQTFPNTRQQCRQCEWCCATAVVPPRRWFRHGHLRNSTRAAYGPSLKNH
mmetsp:Transcript_18603/g.65084  ORF Transcript_18603/g.65084 Transcript_18603/m.65084 type:complete len:227 (+) Transcript_18603:1384-2064(+)